MNEPMNDDPQFPEAELARLADGSLPAVRESELRVRAQASPELAGALAEQQRALALLSAIDASAPASLRARVQQLTEAKTAPSPVRRRRRLLGLVVPAAVVLTLAVIVVFGGRASAPTVRQTVRLTLARATLPTPPQDLAHPGRLELHVGAVQFPSWSGWQPAGARTDELSGRRVVTVFYTRAGGYRIGYAIVSGAPLRAIAGRSVLLDGVRFTQAREGSAALVTWVQAGHTCVIAATTVASSQLAHLAYES